MDPGLSYALCNKGRVCWDNTIAILPDGSYTIEKFEESKGEKECPIIPICDH